MYALNRQPYALNRQLDTGTSDDLPRHRATEGSYGGCNFL